MSQTCKLPWDSFSGNEVSERAPNGDEQVCLRTSQRAGAAMGKRQEGMELGGFPGFSDRELGFCL